MTVSILYYDKNIDEYQNVVDIEESNSFIILMFDTYSKWINIKDVRAVSVRSGEV